MGARKSVGTVWESLALYDACRSDAREERGEAYRWLWDYLYRVCSYMLSDRVDGDAMAQDAAQTAMIKIHGRMDRCREPAAFIAWSRRIASHAAIDLIRRDRRQQPLPDPESGRLPAAARVASPAAAVISSLDAVALRALIEQAPLSNRSRRVVIGRYLDDRPDTQLAPDESYRSGKTVLPSHIQVTRSKNLAKLRGWPRLQQFAMPAEPPPREESSGTGRASPI